MKVQPRKNVLCTLFEEDLLSFYLGTAKRVQYLRSFGQCFMLCNMFCSRLMQRSQKAWEGEREEKTRHTHKGKKSNPNETNQTKPMQRESWQCQVGQPGIHNTIKKSKRQNNIALFFVRKIALVYSSPPPKKTRSSWIVREGQQSTVSVTVMLWEASRAGRSRRGAGCGRLY